jgi:hypothetical protein
MYLALRGLAFLENIYFGSGLVFFQGYIITVRNQSQLKDMPSMLRRATTNLFHSGTSGLL